jgi:hypothetical protein
MLPDNGRRATADDAPERNDKWGQAKTRADIHGRKE